MDKEECKEVPATNSSTNAEMQNWQATYNTLIASLGFLLFNEMLSDITFIVGNEQVRIPAHKFILSIRSTVFQTMFYGTLCEANEVEIPDIQSSAFRHLLKYLYIDDSKVEPESVITTLYAAKKYDVRGLEQHCESLLATSLSTENAFLLLSQARLFDASHLISSCLDMIDKQTQACLDAKCFLDIDYDTLEVVVRRDTLCTREIFLYQAMMRWSEAECKRHDLPVTSDNQKHVLKDCIKLIRYTLMSNQEFARGPAGDDLLTDKEVAYVFLYINGNPKPHCEFQNQPRSFIITSEIICNWFQESPSDRYYNSKRNSSLKFRVGQRIFVSGFGLFGTKYSYQLEVDFELKNIVTNTIIASNTTTLISNGSKEPYKVRFKKPVDIMPYTSYEAVVTMKNGDNFYEGRNSLPVVTVTCGNDRNVTFMTSNVYRSDNIARILFYA